MRQQLETSLVNLQQRYLYFYAYNEYNLSNDQVYLICQFSEGLTNLLIVLSDLSKH